MINIISYNRTYSTRQGRRLKPPVHVHYKSKRKHATIDGGFNINLHCTVKLNQPTLLNALAMNRKMPANSDNIYFSQSKQCLCVWSFTEDNRFATRVYREF